MFNTRNMWTLLSTLVLVLLIAAILNGLGAMVGFGNLLTAPLGTIFLTLSFLKLTE